MNEGPTLCSALFICLFVEFSPPGKGYHAVADLLPKLGLVGGVLLCNGIKFSLRMLLLTLQSTIATTHGM